MSGLGRPVGAHTLADLDQHSFARSRRSEISVWSGLTAPRALAEGLSCLFQLLGSPRVPELCPRPSRLCLMLPSLSVPPPFFLATPHGMGDLSSPIRDQTPPTLETWSPAHWATREVLLSPVRTPLMNSGPPRFRMTCPQFFPSLLLQGPRFQVRHILSLGRI